MVPKAFDPPADTPLTLQATLELAVPVTIALNGCVTGHCVVLIFRNAIAGVTATPMVMVTLAEPDFVVSAWATAVTVALGGEGKIEGAVYTPAALIVPEAGVPPVTPLTCQVTAVLAAP